MASERVVIDPITRIEGHLRIELQTAYGKIIDAWSENTQYRGIETIVEGRDPRDAWAFVQRICGVCTSVHAIASIAAVEDAIGSQPPEQARLIRDMVLGNQIVQDHVIHFYHLHALDWVNVVNATTADPARTVEVAKALGSTWKGNEVGKLTKVAETVKGIAASGQLSIFTGGYWDHPDYRLPAEADLMAVSHYLDALEFQRSMIRVGTVFGGKNPHPNFLVGGMACTIDPERSESINQVQMDQIKGWLDDTVEFVTTCYYPDVLAIMGVYKDYFDIGAAQPNFLALGLAGATWSGDPKDTRYVQSLSPTKGGVLLDGDLATVHPFVPSKIAENVNSAWMTYENGDDKPLTPYEGETTVNYTGPKPPYTWLADDERYTWCKAPRYDDRVMQVGPQARVLVAYAQKHARTVELVDQALATLGITLAQLNSTAGRVLCRAIEAVVLAELLQQVTFPTLRTNIVAGKLNVFDPTKWEPSTWEKDCRGVGFTEVARGMLSHWVVIKDEKILRYQAVVPTTWLSGGRDPQGNLGPYEYSLAGDRNHPLARHDAPLEPMRTIHSYDPCMSCAVHVLDADGQAPVTVR